MNKILLFDTETTGLIPTIHGIHQLSGFIINNNKIDERFDYKFRPSSLVDIDDEALKISHITREELMNRDLSEQDCFEQFLNLISRFGTKPYIPMGFNVQFDIDMLDCFFKRNNGKLYPTFFRGAKICVLSKASDYLQNDAYEKIHKFNLTAVCKYMGINVDETKTHDGLYDCELTYLLNLKLSALAGSSGSSGSPTKQNPIGEAYDKLANIVPIDLMDTIKFGKYAGLSYGCIQLNDPQYLLWLHDGKIRDIKLSDADYETTKQMAIEKKNERPTVRDEFKPKYDNNSKQIKEDDLPF